MDFLGKLPLVTLQRGQLLAQPLVLVAQPLAQPRRLANFFLEGGQFGVHRHTIVWKILSGQGVSPRFQCRFPSRYRASSKTCVVQSTRSFEVSRRVSRAGVKRER